MTSEFSDDVDHERRLEELEEDRWALAETYRILLWEGPITTKELYEQISRWEQKQTANRALNDLSDRGYAVKIDDSDHWTIATDEDGDPI